VDVAQWVTDAASFCRAYAHRRSQVITVRSVAAATILGDLNELRQVLVNVLLNACQASANGASIDIQTAIAEPGHVSIVVRDEGSGMTPELMARVFEPFYSTKQDGGGLGLAISRDIILQHGGEIVLQSVVGTGTTATIRLPLGDSRGSHPRS
jgi:signal transduction histidine kinase